MDAVPRAVRYIDGFNRTIYLRKLAADGFVPHLIA